MKFERTAVWGFEHALRGMRNPKESWGKSDSGYGCELSENHFCGVCEGGHTDSCPKRFTTYRIGKNDMKLAQTLIRAGSEHRKFMRQIFVSADITAPLYWWKEFDTYKVGTVANSTSTMHKMASKPITLDCFETDDYNGLLQLIDPTHLCVRVDCFIDDLEQLRQLYLQTGDKKYWKELIRWLPESWLQTRTITFSYENLLAMCGRGQRRSHKLNEWSGVDNKTLPNFIAWARSLPYAQELIFIDEVGVEA